MGRNVCIFMAVMLILLYVVFSALVAHGAEMKMGDFVIIGKEWKIIKADSWEIQNVWKSRVEPERRDLEVWGFIDFEKLEIWYQTLYDLTYHINLIKAGPEAWTEELVRDYEAAREQKLQRSREELWPW